MYITLVNADIQQSHCWVCGYHLLGTPSLTRMNCECPHCRCRLRIHVVEGGEPIVGIQISALSAALLPASVCQNDGCIAVTLYEDQLYVAASDSCVPDLHEKLRFIMNQGVVLLRADATSIQRDRHTISEWRKTCLATFLILSRPSSPKEEKGDIPRVFGTLVAVSLCGGMRFGGREC